MYILFDLFNLFVGVLCMWSLLMVMADWYYTWDEPMERVDMYVTNFGWSYVTRSDKKGLIAHQILTIISRFEIL